jgi:hypothetical protein
MEMYETERAADRINCGVTPGRTSTTVRGSTLRAGRSGGPDGRGLATVHEFASLRIVFELSNPDKRASGSFFPEDVSDSGGNNLSKVLLPVRFFLGLDQFFKKNSTGVLRTIFPHPAAGIRFPESRQAPRFPPA